MQLLASCNINAKVAGSQMISVDSAMRKITKGIFSGFGLLLFIIGKGLER